MSGLDHVQANIEPVNPVAKCKRQDCSILELTAGTANKSKQVTNDIKLIKIVLNWQLWAEEMKDGGTSWGGVVYDGSWLLPPSEWVGRKKFMTWVPLPKLALTS